MTMAAVLCAECERPVADALTLCMVCGERLVAELLAVPGLVEDLAVTRARLDRLAAPRQGGSAAEAPMPVRTVAVCARCADPDHEDGPCGKCRTGADMLGDEVLAWLTNAVTTWARLIADSLGVEVPVDSRGLAQLVANGRDGRRDTPPVVDVVVWFEHVPVGPPRRRARVKSGRGADVLTTPATAVELAAVWLACHPHEVRSHPAAGELAAEVVWAVERLRAITDRPPERRYLGMCGVPLTDGTKCPHELRAERGAGWVRCPRCRTQHDVRAIEDAARDAARTELYPLAELVRVLATVGEPVPRRTVYDWAQRGRLLPAPGTELYRLADALELAEQRRERGGSAA
ncbi:hypothetical protein [Nocardia sp. NPDC046763]|uniref:hypothetical protein n=1 Tax=Nocardia sp. NPDC046763 TaxID=3155256 RepID=UPI0033E45616